ncbi:hypothetical protein CGZ80_13750 [Rhodopirellula sp. MGV]|nr:hypothetical protein CGZ80_13750 [Rhodopirellula sp. MGV]PNY34351.1 hypothetical protein C2E31_24305 [Rhodopirellula baltica]
MRRRIFSNQFTSKGNLLLVSPVKLFESAVVPRECEESLVSATGIVQKKMLRPIGRSIRCIDWKRRNGLGDLA